MRLCTSWSIMTLLLTHRALRTCSHSHHHFLQWLCHILKLQILLLSSSIFFLKIFFLRLIIRYLSERRITHKDLCRFKIIYQNREKWYMIFINSTCHSEISGKISVKTLILVEDHCNCMSTWYKCLLSTHACACMMLQINLIDKFIHVYSLSYCFWTFMHSVYSCLLLVLKNLYCAIWSVSCLWFRDFLMMSKAICDDLTSWILSSS